MDKRLILKKLVDGHAMVVGELDLDRAPAEALTVKAQGADAEQLRAAWSEVAALAVIRMKWSEPDPSDKTGDLRLLKGRDVPRGDPDYPRAVADLLSRRYGLFATPAEFH